MDQKVTTYYLEMTSRSELIAKTSVIEGFEVIRCELPLPEYNMFFYANVGKQWQWIDRQGWPREKWLEYLDRDELQTWVGYLRGTPAGYFELEMQANQNVQIVYFGIIPQFIGQGLGRLLLTKSIQCAWDMNASRVWLHTCSLDHGHALPNYQARGFRLYKEETK